MFDEQPDGDPHGECAAEIHRLEAEVNAIMEAIPGTTYMDPPDGGAPTLAEQVRRMAKDAARYLWLRQQHWNEAPLCVVVRPRDAVKLGHDCPALDRLDAAIDAAMAAAATAKEPSNA